MEKPQISPLRYARSKNISRKGLNTEISPLRFASVEMTKVKVTLCRNISTKGPWNCRSLGFPGFPVESCGFGQLHVVLFRENHISGRRRER
jgi:hypothetical protein